MSTATKYPNRQQDPVKTAAPGRVQEAREAGPHGSQVHTDGSTQASANSHHAPLKGEDDGPGNRDNIGENYRPGGKSKIPGEGPVEAQPHYGSKEAAQGGFDERLPQPAGKTHGGSTVPFESTRQPLPVPDSYKNTKK